MNVIQLCGGLGNQLFQYAFGQAQAANGIEVRYDDTWYKKYEQFRPYRLDKFYTNVKVGFMGRRFFKENGFNSGLLKIHDRNFSGYWQYLGYYDNILSILRKEFQVKEEFYTEEFLKLREKIVNNNSVSIHVRRGDYLKLKNFPVIPLSYYLQTLEYVKGDLFIFSDDLKWCKEHFKQDYFLRKIIFIDLEDYLDFELMRLCKYNIISNSSFSWWAAYLNNNPKKIVVAPTQWILNKEGPYPKDWIKI